MAHDSGEQGRRQSGLSRRGFLQGAGVAVAAGSMLDSAEAATGAEVVGPGTAPVVLKINGVPHALNVEPRATLADTLRFQLGLTGTKVVCDRGSCSACTVHLDGVPVCSCMTLAIEVGDRAVTTIEGLAQGETLLPIQQSFINQDAMQCGFCTSGMVMSCAALLARNNKPSLSDVQTATSGNLCRCGTYPKVFAAALEASGQSVPKQLEMASAASIPAPTAGVLVGIVGDKVTTESRVIPADEAPAWPSNASLQVVGKSTPRIDGRLKVTGAAKYTADIQLPGMLFARRVCSPHPHAEVKSIDTRAAERVPGVKAVHVVERLYEGAKLRDTKLVPTTRYPVVRYAGQSVAAVAATSQAIADEAARLIRVEYRLLPFTVDLDEALGPNAPLVFPGPTEQPPTAGGGGAPPGLPQKGNVRGPNLKQTGDVEKGLAEAEVRVSGEFRTHVQTHSALETHGVVADWRGDGLTVYASTQGTASVRDELAEVFGLQKSQVRVVSEFMGGGFGAKFGAGSHGVMATHLSKKAGAPVRLMLDRKEEHTAVGNRPSTIQTVEIGAKRDGTLTAVKVVSHGTGGISTGAGVGFFAERAYPSANFHSEQYDVFTHAGPAAAFRAPGNPQGAFALEQLVDELAEKLGIDPLALRDKLDTSPNHEPERDARRVERRVGAAKAGWSSRHKPGADSGVVKRGLGVAQSVWGRFVDLNSSCDIRLTQDGSVEVMSSVQDIGTGTKTVLAQIAAEELGLHASDITMHTGDTQFPIGPASGGSKTLVGISSVVRNAAFRLKQQFLQEIAPTLGVAPEALTLVGGTVQVKSVPPRAIPFKQAASSLKREQITVHATRAEDYGGNPHSGYGGVQFAQVAVDTATGVIRVERVVAVHDVGRPLNPLTIQSQVNGGVIHGLSWALFEHRHMDKRSGRMLNANLDQYKIAGSRETPQIDVVLLEQYQGRTSTDANGIGEPANISTAAAIANAVYNATGVRIRELPMTPAVVLAALKGARG